MATGLGHAATDMVESNDHDDDNGQSSDDEDQSSDDGFSEIEDPSTDVRGDLENILSDLDFKGSIAFSRTYEDAPNPALRLDNFGAVGLPLNVREAKLVVDHCVQAPFGKGERTVVDKEVRDTWEMDAAKIHFDNPAWAKFLERTVTDVCQALGVNAAASKPRCELYKLLLYETGSHFLPHVDSEKANGMFASVIIVLPSLFSGGDAHLSHGNQTMVLNSSRASAYQTTVLAWYTDVMHEVKPIKSGYRLALAYNLVHTTTSLRPSLADTSSSVSRLRHVMLSWKQSKDKDNEIDKVIIELDHQYSLANLSASALKGSDANVVAVVDEVAKELGMCLGLAHLQHHISGSADDDGYGYHRNCYYDEQDDDDDVGMLEVYERDTSIENLVDMDGRSLSKSIEFEPECESIPRDFISILEDGKHDEQDYEGYMGNGAGSLDRYYRRTVFLIWPRWSSLGTGGDRRAAYAFDRLRESSTTEPDPQDVAHFFNALGSDQPNAFSILCDIARQWNRADLWQQVILAQPDKNKVHEIFDAVSTFGFDGVKPSIEQFLQQMMRNSQRVSFLDQMRAWVASQSDNAIQDVASAFIQERKVWILEHIRPPLDTEVAMLTNESFAHGGLKFFVTTMLPQLLIVAPHKVLGDFATALYIRREELAKNAEDKEVIVTLIGDILSKAADMADFFPARIATYRGGYESTAVHDTSFAFIKKCITCDQIPVAARAIERIVEVGQGIPADERERVTSVLLPLITLLAAEIKSHSPPLPLPLDAIGTTVIRTVMDSDHLKKGELSKGHLDAMLAAASVTSDHEILTTTILPKLKVINWNISALKTSIEQLHVHSAAGTFAGAALTALKDTITALTSTYASKVDMFAAPPYSYYNPARISVSDQIGAAVDFCLGMGGLQSLKIVLDRVLDQKRFTKDYISLSLFPLIPLLRQSATKHQITLTTEPVAPALRIIMRLWLQHVLGPKPDEKDSRDAFSTLSGWRCSCNECTRVITFIKKDPAAEISLDRIGAPKRRHVEGFLSMYARGAVSFDTIRTTPQGLKVIKKQAIVAPSRWKANQDIGRRALKQLGSRTEQNAIFGDDYPAIIGALEDGQQISVQRPTATARLPRAVPTAASSSVAKPKPTPAAPVTPAKRKSTVIDLCTP